MHCYTEAVTSVLLTLSFLLQAAPAAAPARPATISGQIHTRDGFPAVAVRVSAILAPPIAIRQSDGQNYWATQPPAATAITDANGRYRLTGIPPGRFYVVAGILGQATYFPGQLDPERATVLTLASAAAETADFRLAVAHGGSLTGRITPAGTGERAVLSGLKLDEILEMPIDASGRFVYGHVPKGEYLLSIFPTPPGMPSIPFTVGDADVALEIPRPAVRTVSGRVRAEQGPLPRGLLAFVTGQSHVGARINADRTFSVGLHQGTHLADMAGLPVGYAIKSVTLGGRDVTAGLPVGAADLADVEIVLSAPRQLPAVRGRVSGVTGAAAVELTGPIVGAITAPIAPDGSFAIAAITPGRYTVRVPDQPAIAPVNIVALASDTAVDVTLGR